LFSDIKPYNLETSLGVNICTSIIIGLN